MQLLEGVKRRLTILALTFGALVATLSHGFATAPDIIAADPPPAGTVGEVYFYDFDITPSPYIVGVQNLPQGINFDADEYTFSGTPTESGTFDVVIYAKNMAEEETRIHRSMVIAPAPVPPDPVPPTIAITNVVVRTLTGKNKFEFSFYFLANDDQALASPDALEYRGGVNHQPLDAWVSYPYGGPGAAFIVGLECSSFEFEVRAVDRAGNRSAAVNYKFEAPGSTTKPTITSSASAKGRVRKPFTYEIKATGATRFTATGLPPGLKLDAKTGVISGKPKKAGTFSIALTAANSIGSGKKTVRIKITGR
ncbi:MAG: Ig domain-containing protein [Chthoniobacterales bacterium]